MGKLKINLDFSLKKFELVAKGLTESKFLGSYASAFKGEGLEFADYRKYIPGQDDAERIDWKASQRVNDLIVKEYVEERNLEVLFLVDVSEKMLAGSTSKLKAEYIAELVASLSRSMLSAGDSVGLILFSDKIVKFVRPSAGLKQIYGIIDALSNTANYGSYSNLDLVLDYVFKTGNDNSLVILISDFIYPLGSEKDFRLVSRKFDLINIMVRDPIDMIIPKGTGEVIVQDPVSRDTLLVDLKKVRKDYSKQTSSDVTKIGNFIRKSGADFLFLETNKSFIKPLMEFFKRRESEWG